MLTIHLLLQFLLAHSYDVGTFFDLYKQAHEYATASNTNVRECSMNENILMIKKYFIDQHEIDTMKHEPLDIMVVVHGSSATKEFELQKYDGFILKMARLYTRFYKNKLETFVNGDLSKEEDFLNDFTMYNELFMFISSYQTTDLAQFKTKHEHFFRKFFNITEDHIFNNPDILAISNRVFNKHITNKNNFFIDFEFLGTETDEECMVAIFEKRTIHCNGGSVQVLHKTRITPYYFYKNNIFYENTVFNKMLDYTNAMEGVTECIKTKNDFNMNLCNYKTNFLDDQKDSLMHFSYIFNTEIKKIFFLEDVHDKPKNDYGLLNLKPTFLYYNLLELIDN